jgi:hypothetical protein
MLIRVSILGSETGRSNTRCHVRSDHHTRYRSPTRRVSKYTPKKKIQKKKKKIEGKKKKKTVKVMFRMLVMW